MSAFIRMMHCLQSVTAVSPVPPAPGYNYILLNNFITPMPSPMPNPIPGVSSDDFCNTVPAEWESNYQDNELVSNVVDDPLLDTDTPIDFSGKNIQTGTPFGIVDWTCCTNGEGPRYAITEGALSNGCTIELWYKSDYSISDETTVWPAFIGTDDTHGKYPNLLLSMNVINATSYEDPPTYSVMLRLSTGDYSKTDYNQTISTNWLDGNWHHYAITYDSTNTAVHFFIDGYKVKTIDDCPTDIQHVFEYANHVDFAQGTGNDMPKGRFAQVAVCDECKWTDDFTVPTVAY